MPKIRTPISRNNERNTYNPEQPSLKLEDRDDVSTEEDHVRDNQSSHSESGVEVRAQQAQGSEESLKSQECNVGEQVESEETSC